MASTPQRSVTSTTTSRRTPKSPITSEAEREQALRDYKLTIEYKHLKQHSPSGVYLLPSPSSLRTFHGVIFLRRGLYANGIFKFTMELPPGYNDVDMWPEITFQGWVYSPHVDESGALDLKSAYPQWDPHRHYLVTVLTYLKKIFYMKSFGDDAVANIDARELSRNDPKEYRRMVSKCVKESQRGIFMNEPGSSLVFKEENECHVALRMLMKEKFQDVTMVSRTLVLECVEEAQRIAVEATKNGGRSDKTIQEENGAVVDGIHTE